MSSFEHADAHDGRMGYEDLRASGADIEPDVAVSDDDVLGLAFTSGTTGLPKGVLQPQRMLKSLIINMSMDYEIGPDEFRYTASPTFHIAGQGMILDTFQCDFINAFGAATEGGLQTVLSSADHRRAASEAPHLLGSIGKPAFGVDLRIVDELGTDLPIGKTGEIITRSDAVMTSYLEMPEETSRTIRDGWVWGGDLARQDADGYLYLAGRSKDMIIRGGENIYPVEIEKVLAEFPGVQQAAVIGRRDDHWGEVVVAFITENPDISVNNDELLSHCRQRLAAYKIPVEVRRLSEMPLNASGKSSNEPCANCPPMPECEVSRRRSILQRRVS